MFDTIVPSWPNAMPAITSLLPVPSTVSMKNSNCSHLQCQILIADLQPPQESNKHKYQICHRWSHDKSLVYQKTKELQQSDQQHSQKAVVQE
ncbi:hypothetical protein X801_04215, partial [Opisthorchis viverrini]